eukprot:TRINITY_DN127_c1_g4_i4.p2 TRINITY_DN127_c1_g4~~TRINITY_DN127_c1_g4_i4.p2  ORF type:complete len:265 (-),score=84.35 TRINITY_DN127_c1_g4_i4:174-968(-)
MKVAIVLLVAAVCAVSASVGVHNVEDVKRSLAHVPAGSVPKTAILESCTECELFLKQMDALAARAATTEKKLDDDKKQMPEIDAQLANAKETQLCQQLEPNHIKACEEIAQIYGLDNVRDFVNKAPDLLCEQLSKCSPSEGKKLTHDEVVSVLNDVLAKDADTLVSAPQESIASGMTKMMGSLFHMRMQSQLMMQAMQMRQQLMENEHKMMQKVLRAMSRNRAIRSQLKHLKKMAYRAQPGNCDCCEACLPAKGSGSGSGSGSS